MFAAKLAAVSMILLALALGSPVVAEVEENPQIYWVQSPQMAKSLAKQFDFPILIYVTSESCYHCRKMEQEVWANPQIVEMVESGFIPLELNATRDAKTVAALGVRAFPTTLVFTPQAKFTTGAVGYLPTRKLAGLLRSIPPRQPASQQVTQAK